MQRILYALIIIIATGACKLQEQDNPLVVGTCRDGIKNQDEEGVDCGGVCLACLVQVPAGQDAWSPCHESLKSNIVTISGTAFTVIPGTTIVDAPQLKGKYYEYTIPMQNGSLRIWLAGGTKPTKNSIYNLTKTPSTDSLRRGFAHIYYKDGSSGIEYSSTDGHRLYMTVKNGTLTFEVCNVKLDRLSSYGDSNQSVTIDGQIVYKAPPPMIYGCNRLVTTNQFMFDGSISTFDQSNIEYSEPRPGADYYEFRITASSSSSYYTKTLYIRLSADRALTADRVYTITESTAANSPKPGEAYIAYNSSYTYYSGKSNDKLYMTITPENQVKFEFCAVDMFYYSYTEGLLYGLIMYQR